MGNTSQPLALTDYRKAMDMRFGSHRQAGRTAARHHTPRGSSCTRSFTNSTSTTKQSVRSPLYIPTASTLIINRMTTSERSSGPIEMSNRSQKLGLIYGILFGIPAFIIVLHFSDIGRARAAAVCAIVNAVVLRRRWDSRGRLSLWCGALLVLVVQAIVIALVPFSDLWLGPYGLLPAGLVVYLFDETVVFFLTRRSF